jgi:hypothetical protein
MRRASRGRLLRPSSCCEVRGASGSALGWSEGLLAESVAGGVEGWPFWSWGEAMVWDMVVGVMRFRFVVCDVGVRGG